MKGGAVFASSSNFRYLILKKSIIVAGVGFLSAAVIMGLTYCGISLFYANNHFLQNTVVNNVAVGGLTIQEAEQKINSHIDNYKLLVETKNGNHEILPENIGLTYNVEEYSLKEELKKQNHFEWLTASFMEPNDLVVGAEVNFDDKKLDKTIKDFNLNEKRAKPQDAKITKGETAFEIEKEKKTDFLNLENVKNAIEKSINQMSPSVLLDAAEFYTQPKVSSSDLKETITSLNKQVNKNMIITCVKDNVNIDPKLVYKWAILKGNKITGFNHDLMQVYVNELASKYNTVGIDRKFKTSNGKTITVGAGSYGWEINVDSTVEKIEKKLMDPDFEGQFAAEYTTDGFSIHGNGSDIGNTYVEISISDQHMWYYKDGKLLVETDVVTGNNDGEHDTPKGVWYVLYKDSPATLVGENDEYRTEVTYWMPITYGGVGIHDSSWRGSGEYGGDTYTYNGSHGCINTPYDKVEKIYKNLDAGTPVIVY